MKKLLGLLVVVATLGFAAPLFACGKAGCDCNKAKEANCSHEKHEGKSCSHAKSDESDSEAPDAEASKRATFRVEGMSCGNCAQHLASTLEEIDGVVKADVSFEAGEAEVEFDADAVDAASLVESIEAAHSGKFDAELVSEASVKS